MPIAFDAPRWNVVRDTYARWWAGQLDRPLVPVVLTGRDPGRREPALPYRNRAGQYPLSVPVGDIVDRWDYLLCGREYVADAFPWVWMDFGPGVLAAMLGAELLADDATIWFKPREIRDVRDLHFAYDPDNVWLRRIKALAQAAMDRWQGQVLVGMTDLGGTLDILSTFRPGELLLMDLIDQPDEVRRLIREIHEIWHRCHEEINAILHPARGPASPGYAAWAGIYSPRPHYMLQCDLAYMVGPEMFAQFVRPELAASCRRIPENFYHLDGVGQLPHLDALLAIPELKGVQWVPGAGKPGCGHWPDVYRRIRAAGKLVQFLGGFEELHMCRGQLQDLRGFVTTCLHRPLAQRRQVEAELRAVGVTAADAMPCC